MGLCKWWSGVRTELVVSLWPQRWQEDFRRLNNHRTARYEARLLPLEYLAGIETRLVQAFGTGYTQSSLDVAERESFEKARAERQALGRRSS